MVYSPLSKNWEQPCSYCKVLIKQGDLNVYLDDKKFLENTQLQFVQVWHQDCWDKHLDDGESLE